MKKSQCYDIYVKCSNKLVEGIVNTVRKHVKGKGLNGQYMKVNYFQVTDKPKTGKTLFSFTNTDNILATLDEELSKIVEMHQQEEVLHTQLFKHYQHLDGVLPNFFVRKDMYVCAFTTINNDDDVDLD